MATASTNRISIINYSGDDNSLIRSLDILTGFNSAALGSAHELKVDLNDISKATVDHAVGNYEDGFTLFVKLTGEDLSFGPNITYKLKIKFSGDADYHEYGNVVIPPRMFETRERVKFASGDMLILHQTDGTNFTVVNSETSMEYLAASNHSSNAAYLVKGSGYSGTGAGTKFLREDGTWITLSNTDTKVSQTPSTTTSWRPLLMGYSTNNGSASATFANATNSAYINPQITCQPGNGYIKAVKFIVKDGTSAQYLKGDGTLSTLQTLASNSHESGTGYLVNGIGTVNTQKFLCSDGSWQIPKGTTYEPFGVGSTGLVIGPTASSNTNRYLRGDGTWQEPYSVVTQSANGLAPKINNTNGFLRGDSQWVTIPTLSTNAHATNATYVIKGSGYSGTGAGTKFLREDGTWQSVSGGGDSSDAVLYTQQSLSAAQQAQARQNINALSATTSATAPDVSFNAYNVVVLDDESEMPATPASNTLYFIKETAAS